MQTNYNYINYNTYAQITITIISTQEISNKIIHIKVT